MNLSAANEQLRLEIEERKRAEAALRDSERKFRAVFENALDAMFLTIPDGQVLAANPAACAMFGMSEAELCRVGRAGIMNAADTRLAAALAERARTGRINTELTFVRKDGMIFPAEVQSVVLGDDQKQSFVILRDITERKRANDALALSELRFRVAIAGSPITLMEQDLDLRCTWVCNPAPGCPDDLLLGKTDADWHTPEDAAKIMAVKRRAMETGVTQREVFSFVLDGQVRHYDAYVEPRRDTTGRICGIIGLAADITQRKRLEESLIEDISARKQAEAALRESERRASTFFRASLVPAGISRIADELFVEVNDAFLNMFGYARDEVLGHSARELCLWPVPEERARAIRTLHEQGRVKHLEAKFRKKSGEVGDALISAEFIELNRERYMFGTLMDITERKRAEEQEERSEALKQQLQKVESLGRMAGAIAHRFNNQLQVVIGNLERVKKELPPGTSVIQRAEQAMEAALKAAAVSGSLLTYLGQPSGKRESLDLSAACEHWLPTLRTALPQGVILESDLPCPGPAIAANVNQIQQILTNLVTNAWESFGGLQGTIRLSIRMMTPADIATICRFPIEWQPLDEAYACMEVADGGCGIAGEDLQKLFDPFYSTKFMGRGMGLAVVLGIVRAHGGAITVESGPGQGSAFQVYFPVSGEPVPRQPQATPAPAGEPDGTVLLVEDDPAVREMAAMMLKELGHAVIQARDGVEAIEVFRQRKDEIRCVVCDLTMPRMNGWDTLAALRQLSPGIPVVLASGYDQAHVMSGEHPAWPQVFLGKPYELEAMSKAIGVALGGGKGTR